MKHQIILFLLLLCVPFGLEAFTVKNLTADPMDISAVRNKRTSDGHTAALVKVALQLPECEFFGNTVGDIDYINGEYWVYLEPNSISLTILSKTGEEMAVDFNKFGLPKLESSVTYKMECELSTRERKDLLGDVHGGDTRTEYNVPKHLSKVFKKKGEIYYMTQEEWLQQPYDTFFHVEHLGIVIEYKDKMFLFPSRYVLDVNGDECEFSYAEAKEYIKENPDLRMLNYEEAEYILSIQEDIIKASAAGEDGGAPYFIGGFFLAETWIFDENHPDKNFLSAYMGFVGNLDDPTQKRQLRAIKDIKY